MGNPPNQHNLERAKTRLRGAIISAANTPVQGAPLHKIVWGVVSAVTIGNPNTLSMTIRGSTRVTSGIKFNATYAPQIGDTVMCQWYDTDLVVVMKLAAGAPPPETLAAIIASTSAINTTETLIEKASLVPGYTLQPGSVVRITLQGTCTSSAGNTSTFTVRAGTLGTTGDASVATATVTAASSGSAVPFKIVIDFTVQSVGAAGVISGSMEVVNNGTTGIASSTPQIVTLSTATIATTTASFLSVTYKSSASTTTCTFTTCAIEVL